MEFLRKKWSFFFTIIDVNHDGLITRADVDQQLKEFSTVEGLTEEEGKLANERLEHWWNTYILKGRKQVTEEELIQDFEKQYTTDKQAFIDTVKQMEGEICTILDADKTKLFSLDKYMKGYQVFGHDWTDLAKTCFKMFKPSADGMVPLQEYIDDWVHFLSGDDENNPGPVMESCILWTKSNEK